MGAVCETLGGGDPIETGACALKNLCLPAFAADTSLLGGREGGFWGVW